MSFIFRLTLSFAFAVSLAAQIDRATLAGSVSDSSGAIVPGARVEVASQDTGLRREMQSSETGAYTFSLLPIGVYTVTVEHAGFRKVSMTDLRLGVGDNRTLNIELQVSSVGSDVTVEGVLAPLDSTSAVVGTVIGGKHMREIPLNGRHWATSWPWRPARLTPVRVISSPFDSLGAPATTTIGRSTAWTPPA